MLGFKYTKVKVDGETVHTVTINDWAAVAIIVAWVGVFTYFVIT